MFCPDKRFMKRPRDVCPRPAFRLKPAMHCQKGVSLVEMAIVIVIIAAMAGMALSMGSSQNSQAKLKQSYDKMAMVEEAFALFVRMNGRLPCPADPRQPRLNAGGAANPNLGLEDCTANTQITVAGVPGAFAGAVPTQTLNLSPELMIDGWDRRFTYVVEERFIDRINFAANFEGNTLYAADYLEVDDGITMATGAGARSRNAVMVLISHGENGEGAWNKEGTARIATTTANAAQLLNARNRWSGGAGAAADKRFAQTMRSGVYDDIVHYMKKGELVRQAGGVIQNEVCGIAKRVLMPPRNRRDLDTTAGEEAAIEGPMGCELNAGMWDAGYVDPPTGAAYETAPRNMACMTRQLDLAKQIAERCLYY
ncbi:prepilin-type N-terminal cleavage/methylation domain-containing protein [bacterium]|nr:prepilin-type N-terminal cleavage/methylation domain-containing protein [bacterium]